MKYFNYRSHINIYPYKGLKGKLQILAWYLEVFESPDNDPTYSYKSNSVRLFVWTK